MNYSEKCKIKFLSIVADDIPDDQYFKIKGVSNSKLKLINPLEGGSPELYLQGFSYTFNPSLDLGTAIHSQILQPDDFILSDYKGKPSGKLGLFIDCVYKYRKKKQPLYLAIENASKEANYYVDKLTPKILRKAINQGLDYYLRKYKGEFTNPEKEVLVLPEKLLFAANKCIKSLKNNYEISKILSPGIFDEKEFFNEIAIFIPIEVTFPNEDKHIINFKGKLDSVVVDHENKKVYLNDIKTTSKPINFFMDKVIDGEVYNGVISHHHYYRQLACYMVGLQMFMREIKNKKDYSYECNIFAVETTNTYLSNRFRINQSYLDEGLKEFKDLICRVAYLEKYGIENKYPEIIDD